MSAAGTPGRAKATAVGSVVRLLPTVAPVQTSLLATLVGGKVAATAGLTVAVGALIGAVAAGDDRALALSVVVAAVFVVDAALAPVRDLLAARLGRMLGAAVARGVVSGTLRPSGVRHLDQPAVAEQLAAAKEASTGAFRVERAVPALATLVTVRMVGVVAAVLLCGVSWWMPVVLATVWLVVGRWQDQRLSRGISGSTGGAVPLRRALYLRDAALSGGPAMEIRVFGLQRWLVAQFAAAWQDGMGQLQSGASDLGRRGGELALLGAAHLAVLVALASAAADGRIGVSDLTVAIQAVIGMAALGAGGDPQWLLRMASASVPAALAASRLGRQEHTAGVRSSAADLPAHGIRFDKVRFGYSAGTRPILDGLDLWVPAGTSLAIVGDNGAGKSTVIKLLAALYEPDAGQISVDGCDLSQLDPTSWRRQLAVVLQEFTRYELSVRDNIGFGCVDAPRPDDALERAAEKGGFADVAIALPGRWDTRLGRRYADGAELSGGQWQRLALTRALFAVDHGATVLILDEPAAHLDARAERRLYARFLELTHGLTTIMVSHRFATVRLADRIAVLHEGQVVEYGSHDELVSVGGRYAAMFAIQAEPDAIQARGNGHA